MGSMSEMTNHVGAVLGRDKERKRQWVLVLLLSDGSTES